VSPAEWGGNPIVGEDGEPRIPATSSTPWYARFSKLIAGVLGTLTPQIVFSVLEENGVQPNPWLSLGVTTAFAAAAIWRAPKNRA